QWASPPFEKRADYIAAPVARDFRTLAEYQKTTGQDAHSRLVGYDVFVNVPKPDASDPQRIYDVTPLDFGLRKRSAAVDAGTPLRTVTEGFTGGARDLGALELGSPAPRYGPRATQQPTADGRPGAPRSSAAVEAMFTGFTKYQAIRGPILAIFAVPHAYGPE